MTTVELFEDIGLDMTMKRTMEFATKSKQDIWFSSRVSKTITDVAFNKLQNILKLPMDYGEALKYTYVRFKDLDASGRMYYYFVASIELVDDSTVAMHLAVDPIQTFMTEWSIGPCMVNRKHCNRWGASDNTIWQMPNQDGIITDMHVLRLKSFTTMLTYGTYGDHPIGAIFISFKKDKRVYTLCSPVFLDTLGDRIRIYQNTELYADAPSLLDFYNNEAFTLLDIDPEAVTAIALVPFFPGIYDYSSGTGFTFEGSGGIYRTEDSSTSGKYYGMFYYSNISRVTFEMYKLAPSKPKDGDEYKTNYEPALFREPFMSYGLTSGDGAWDYTIPDTIVEQGYSNIYIRPIVCPSSQIFDVVIGNDWSINADGQMESRTEGRAFKTNIPTMDIFNNAWLTYCLTQRDSDRQILNNNNIQNAVSNLIFMGYGGALVGSRGGGMVKDVPIYDNAVGVPKSQQTVLGYKRGLNPGLTGAVGLAAGASVVTSLIDAHYAWENQKLQERKIQNKAQSVNISSNNGYWLARYEQLYPTFVQMKCDSDSFDKAAANFRFYGYEINEWQKPDIKSRKYFDYILTNGAIIEGAIPQDIKEQIAKVLDNGITFFHADYSTSTQYNNYENIERALI